MSRGPVAALCDIRGNLPALEAVLEEVRAAGVARVVVGGDVLPGPMPRECLARLLALDIPVDCIQGNGAREVMSPTGAAPEAFREAGYPQVEEFAAGNILQPPSEESILKMFGQAELK